MRDPDKTATLDPGCAALRWTTVGPEVAKTLAAAFGVEVPPEVVGDELAESELEVRCWRMLPRDTGTPDHQGFVGSWIVNGPFNPLWRWWQIAVIHLRPIPGVKAAHVLFPGASHEVMILAIDPTEFPDGPDVDLLERGEQTLGYLRPHDLVHQVILRDDVQGAELLELMIEPILAGDYSPDQDFRSAWESVLDRTAEHLRLDGHPE